MKKTERKRRGREGMKYPKGGTKEKRRETEVNRQREEDLSRGEERKKEQETKDKMKRRRRRKEKNSSMAKGHKKRKKQKERRTPLKISLNLSLFLLYIHLSNDQVYVHSLLSLRMHVRSMPCTDPFCSADATPKLSVKKTRERENLRSSESGRSSFERGTERERHLYTYERRERQQGREEDE